MAVVNFKAVREFIDSIVWTLKVNYSVMPFQTVMRVIIVFFSKLDGLFSAYFFAKLIDDFIKLSQHNSESVISSEELLRNIIIIIAIFVGYKLFSITVTNYGFYIERDIEWSHKLHYNRLLANKLKELNLYDLEAPTFTDKLFRAKENLNELKQHSVIVFNTLGALFSAISAGAIIVGYLPWQVLLIVIIAFPRFFTQGKMLMEEWTFLREATEKRRAGSDHVEILFNNNHLPEIKLNGLYDFFLDRYITVAKWIHAEVLRQTMKRYSLSNGFMVLNYLVIAAAIYSLGLNFLEDKFTIGTLTFLLTTTLNFTEGVSHFVSASAGAYESSVKFEDLKQILTQTTGLKNGKKKLKKTENSPLIEMNNVEFHYPNSEAKVLDKISLKINPGENIAIVGHNGAGKTTLIKLLLRFYELSGGEILINKENLNNIEVNSWYKQVAVLFQEYAKYFMLNVKESVEIGDLERKHSDKDVVAALQGADALDFVNEYPNKLEQSLNEKYKGGIRPSTGQWQKLAIARFLYRNANLVIFDEPTASIDAVSEAKIFENIFEIYKKKTVIIISHRFSTVKKADRIIVIDKGHIVEQGSHKELMDLDGVYANSYRLQADAYK